MRIGYWHVQTDIKEALERRGYTPVPLDWHASDWHERFRQNLCDAYIWYPHALHGQWFKLLDRAFYIENFLDRPCFPGSKTAYLFQDKQHQKYIFDRFRWPTPKTWILTERQEAENFFGEVDYPILVKDIWGYGGHGIQKLNTKKEGREYLRKKRIPKTAEKVRREHYIYAQELVDIKEEYRVMTVGGKVILAYKKTSDQLLKHVWRGAEVSFEVDPEVTKLVQKWNRQLDLDWCGWDLARDRQDNLYLIEINPIFGTKILESRGVNLAEYLVEYMVERVNSQ